MADRMGANMPTRNKIFVSYSHKDGRLFEEFKTMLAPAIQRGLVDLWDDQKIPPGATWKEEIQNALASASIAVLLVSQNFLASHFIAEKELPPLLKAAREDGVTIFWIYLSSCLFEQTEIASYQAAHDISRPLDRLPKSQRQAVLSETCAKLIQAAASAAEPLEPTTTDSRTSVSSSGPATRQALGVLPPDQRKPPTIFSVDLGVTTPDNLRHIEFGLEKDTANDCSITWTIHFKFLERASATDNFIDVVILDVTVKTQNHAAAEATAKEGLSVPQVAHLNGPVTVASQKLQQGKVTEDQVSHLVEATLPKHNA